VIVKINKINNLKFKRFIILPKRVEAKRPSLFEGLFSSNSDGHFPFF